MPIMMTKYPYAQRCGSQVRRLRQARGWTTTELAERAALSQPQISAIELGRVNTPIETLARLAEALGVPLRTLLETEVLEQEEYGEAFALAESCLLA